MQVAIVGGVFAFYVENDIDDGLYGPIVIIGIALAAIATGIVYWSIEGIKALRRRSRRY